MILLRKNGGDAGIRTLLAGEPRGADGPLCEREPQTDAPAPRAFFPLIVHVIVHGTTAA